MLPSVQYSIEVIQEEVRLLVKEKALSRYQPIYAISQFIPAREWEWVERELERNDFLLRDRIIDLLGREDWPED